MSQRANSQRANIDKTYTATLAIVGEIHQFSLQVVLALLLCVSPNRVIKINPGNGKSDQRVGLCTGVPTLSKQLPFWVNQNITLKPFLKQGLTNSFKLSTHSPILKPG